MWTEAQQWEKDWHGKCLNTYREETKQLVYARYMGLKIGSSIDVEDKSIMDIGGGEVSLLLKTRNLKSGTVIDPLKYPDWVYARYDCAGIKAIVDQAENINTEEVYDECWIYNCLQHTVDPELIIKKALSICKTLRIFEWIDVPTDIGHLHILTEDKLNEWLGQKGNVNYLNDSGCRGRAYFGVFKGNL